MLLTTVRAQVYVNHGRWVVNCTRPGCAGAETVRARQAAGVCVNCRQYLYIVWPDDPDGIWDALDARPVPQTRNWYPAGHPLAVRFGLPHGQSVADLHAETAEHMGA